VVEFIVQNPVAAVIVLCEFGLWVLLGLGLALRYLFRLRRASALVLWSIPLLDVVLVVATALDLRGGAEAGTVHGLAAAYLGLSVAFGPAIVRWADARFAHRFAGGPTPPRAPRRGPGRRAHLLREWYRAVNAAAIASAVLLGLIVFFAAPEGREVLAWWIGRVWIVVGLWYVFGPLWEGGGGSGRGGAAAAADGGAGLRARA
jgi:hypothetical protein